MEVVTIKIENKLLNIQQKLKAPKSNYNKFGEYKYRSCEDILEAVKPLLTEVKAVLTITDEILAVNNRVYVKATATLKDTESDETISTSAWAREEESRPKMAEPQCTGSASSYARKYALNGLFCLDDTKDADTMDNTNLAKPDDLIDQQMITALKMLCQKLKINEADLCDLYKVKSLKEFTVGKYSNVVQHEKELQQKLGKE